MLKQHWEGYYRAAISHWYNNPAVVMPSPGNGKLRPVLAGMGTEV